MERETIDHAEPIPLVLPLDAPENTLEAAGGKGANLGVMIRAGLPVPTGFVITTTAYARIAATIGEEAVLSELAALATGTNYRPQQRRNP